MTYPIEPTLDKVTRHLELLDTTNRQLPTKDSLKVRVAHLEYILDDLLGCLEAAPNVLSLGEATDLILQAATTLSDTTAQLKLVAIADKAAEVDKALDESGIPHTKPKPKAKPKAKTGTGRRVGRPKRQLPDPRPIQDIHPRRHYKVLGSTLYLQDFLHRRPRLKAEPNTRFQQTKDPRISTLCLLPESIQALVEDSKRISTGRTKLQGRERRIAEAAYKFNKRVAEEAPQGEDALYLRWVQILPEAEQPATNN